jgi:hypothetical protein
MGINRAAGLNEPRVMRLIGLGMADGQLEQADRWLLAADNRARRPGTRSGDPLVHALEHLRSACGWLITVADL